MESTSVVPNVKTTEVAWTSYSSLTETTSSSATADPGLISVETVILIENIIYIGVLPVIVCFGVTCNIINIFVFLRQGITDKINLCLFCLAVSDTGYMLFVMLSRLYPWIYLFNSSWGEFWKVRMINVVGIYHAFTDTTDCLTMLIAVDRCICVLWPLRAKSILTVRTMRLLVLLSFVLNFSTSPIFCFKYTLITYLEPETNVTRYMPAVSSISLRHGDLFTDVFEYVNIVVPTMCFSVVIISTSLIAVRMISVLAWRQDTTSGSALVTALKQRRRDAAVTRMLTVLCVIFTACLLPYVINSFFRLLFPEYRVEGREVNLLIITLGIVHIFICINSSVNFIIYYKMSSKFKNTLKSMCGGKFSKPGSLSMKTVNEGEAPNTVTVSSFASST